jgi:hypothetical protein
MLLLQRHAVARTSADVFRCTHVSALDARAACVQRSLFMTIFMLAAAIVAPCCWILGGVGLATHEFSKDACTMMQAARRPPACTAPC